MTARSQQIADFLLSLASAQNVESHYATIDTWVGRAEVAPLYELGVALRMDMGDLQADAWAPRAILNHLETALALMPGYAQADTLFKLSAATSADHPDAMVRRRWPRVASMLASAQPLDVLVRIFEHYEHSEAHAELLLLLAHELVIRTIPCDQQPAVVRLFERMKAQMHPLTRLPLALLPDIDADIAQYLPRYSSRSASWPTPAKSGAQPTARMQSADIPRAIEEVLASPGENQMNMCVRAWETESNGKSEIRIFKVSPRLSGDDISPALLLSLPLAALEGAAEQELTITPLAPRHVFSILFAAATNGGAYNAGRCGAYGRLDAWISLAAFVASDEEWQVDAIARQVLDCLWFDVGAVAAWFYHVAWDIMLVTLLPDRQHVVAFAATDTD